MPISRVIGISSNRHIYNSLKQFDQNLLNAAAGGNLLNRTPRDALTIIENKLKELVLMNKANQQASVKAIKETYVTCGGPHPYYECLATDNHIFNASAATGNYNKGALIMRNKEGIDELDIDDLYNNLTVFKADLKDHRSSGQASSSSYTIDLMFSFFTSQSNSPQLDDEDLEHINHVDLEEMNLKWQVAKLSMRVKRYYKKTRRKINFNSKEPIGFDKTKVECFNCHRRGRFARECRAPINQRNRNRDARYRNRDNNKRTILVESSDSLVIQDYAWIMQDGLGYNWSYIAQEEPTEFALMAYTSGTNTELIVHQKNEVAYVEKMAVLEFEVKDKGNAIIRLTSQLDQTLKEKEYLKAKLEQFEISSKNLNKIINSQPSAKDKTGLGYGDQLSESDSEVLPSVFDSRSSDGDDNPTNDRFKKDDGYHAVPPFLTRNYMPRLADLSFAGLDDSVYRPIENKDSASISKSEPSLIKTSNISVAMPKVDSMRSSGVIIEDWVSDDEDTLVDTHADRKDWNGNLTQNPRRSNRRRIPNIFESGIRTIEEIVPMADRTMEELLQAPMEGDVSNDAIKLMLFSYSLEGAARIWYEKEPPNSILTWDDLVNKFHVHHHGFSELTQIDTFYNGLIEQDQDSLNAVAGGNLLNKTTREELKIIENKSKVRYSRSKSNVSRVNTNARDNVSKTDDRIDKLVDQILNLVEIVNQQVITPASAKANQPSTSCTLLTNTVPNPKGEMKAVSTRSGLAYKGTSIPTNSLLEKVVEQNTKEIMDKEHSNCPGCIAQVQHLVMPISIMEPDVSRAQSKHTIPYPSRLNDQKLWMEVCHALADLGAADPRVPLILEISFLRTDRALIDVYGEEITLRVNDESVTFNLNQTMRYSSTCDDNSVNRVDVIDITCEEFVQDVLYFQYNRKRSNPTLVFDSLDSESDFCKEPSQIFFTNTYSIWRK
uniref:Ribonuclease H-like domain-containing protein n=1 Tax=Tanacetum cinerariifolium TaxID=118510 RepID=A0A6L2K1Q9_TANCI|nr:ribonuclease H-like domain-containing protein [Tanacetum cinerariifolium]